MGWIGDKLGDVFGKVGSFIKRGIRKVGGFFKRAFKKIGKFVGRLGPVGMLGMMLIMPQLGAWWADFGAWASKLSGPMSGFMQGVHKAGAWIGEKYTTVTDGIDKALEGFADTVGLGDAYRSGKTWVAEKTEGLQEFLNLETKTGLEAKLKAMEEGALSSIGPEYDPTTTVQRMEEAARLQGVEPFTDPYTTGEFSTDAFEPYKVQQISTTTFDTSIPERLQEMTFSSTQDIQDFMSLSKGRGIELVPAETEYLKNKYISLGGQGESLLVPEKSKWKKFTSKVSSIAEGVETAKGLAEELGITDPEEIEEYYQSYVADNLVPLYDSANLDWTQAGYQGAPNYGIGNSNYLQSIYSSFGEDPYFLWMARQQQKLRSA